MTITAQQPGKCIACGGRIRPGEQIEWDKASRTSRHVQCSGSAGANPQAVEQAKQPADYTYTIGSGYGSAPQVGQTIRRRQTGELYTVLRVRSQYVREDGLSYGVGDDQGYLYTVECRKANDEEIAQRERAERAAAERKAVAERIAAVKREIREAGERPEGDNSPEGERLMDTQNLYGGGDWFVVGADHIWYVQNNGSDGDNWSANNVRTGGAGAIGWRVPRTERLAVELECLAGGKLPPAPIEGGSGQIDKRALMRRAHQIARTCTGDYAARLALGLRQAWAEARMAAAA